MYRFSDRTQLTQKSDKTLPDDASNYDPFEHRIVEKPNS